VLAVVVSDRSNPLIAKKCVINNLESMTWHRHTVRKLISREGLNNILRNCTLNMPAVDSEHVCAQAESQSEMSHGTSYQLPAAQQMLPQVMQTDRGTSQNASGTASKYIVQHMHDVSDVSDRFVEKTAQAAMPSSTKHSRATMGTL
jgi:hypothetical protein